MGERGEGRRKETSEEASAVIRARDGDGSEQGLALDCRKASP